MEIPSHMKCETDWKLAGDCKPTLDPIVPASSIMPTVCSGLHESSRNWRSTLHPRAQRPHCPVDAATESAGSQAILAGLRSPVPRDINISASISQEFVAAYVEPCGAATRVQFIHDAHDQDVRGFRLESLHALDSHEQLILDDRLATKRSRPHCSSRR